MNKSLLAAVAAGAILLLSGCSPIQMDVEELMSPPKLTAEQAEIDSALKQALGENVKLKYPKSGDFRSAFVFHDIDGDGEEEAIVFYQLDSSTTWLTVMDRTDGQWRSTYSSSGLGDDVDFISFANVTDPQREDIVIGWSGESQGDNKVSLYTYEDGRLRSMFKDSYQQLVIVPSDEEGMGPAGPSHLGGFPELHRQTGSQAGHPGGPEQQGGFEWQGQGVCPDRLWQPAGRHQSPVCG